MTSTSVEYNSQSENDEESADNVWSSCNFEIGGLQNRANPPQNKIDVAGNIDNYPFSEHFGSHYSHLAGHTPRWSPAPPYPASSVFPSRHTAQPSHAAYPPHSPHPAAYSSPRELPAASAPSTQAPRCLPHEPLAVSSPLSQAPCSPLHVVPVGSTSAAHLQSLPLVQACEDVAMALHTQPSRPSHVVDKTSAGFPSYDLHASNVDKNPQSSDNLADKDQTRLKNRVVKGDITRDNGREMSLHQQGLQKLNDSTTETEIQLRKSTKQR